MKNPFTRLFRARDKPGATDSVSSAPTFYFGSSAAGKSVTASAAIQMSTVYACVRVIAETIASLPLHVYQNQGEGSVKALDHPLYPILHDEPNSEMTSFIWRETMLAHLLLWGNAYCQIIRSGRSQILGLYPLLPDRMEVDRDSAGTDSRIRLKEDDLCQTLCSRMGTGGNQVPLVFGISSDQSHAMLSENPHAGVYEADTSLPSSPAASARPRRTRSSMATVRRSPQVCFTAQTARLPV